jgi:ketohexokinase/beta-glucosidase
MKRVSQCIKDSIWAAYKAGTSISTLLETYQLSRASIFRILQDRRENGTSNPQNNKASLLGKHSKKTTEEMDEFIISEVEKNRKLLPSQIRVMLQNKFGVSISLTQIKVRLRNAGFKGRVCVRKPLLRPINKLKRLVWAIQHQNWTVEQWQRVLWTDEKKFELFNSKRHSSKRWMH